MGRRIQEGRAKIHTYTTISCANFSASCCCLGREMVQRFCCSAAIMATLTTRSHVAFENRKNSSDKDWGGQTKVTLDEDLKFFNEAVRSSWTRSHSFCWRSTRICTYLTSHIKFDMESFSSSLKGSSLFRLLSVSSGVLGIKVVVVLTCLGVTVWQAEVALERYLDR